VTIRRSLTPPLGIPVPGLPPTRRVAGARREVSTRVELRQGDRVIPGWALNRSRGGVRAVVEERVDLGVDLAIAIGDEPARPGRVVWTQDEPDGTIIGVSFLEADGAARSEPPPAGDA
jgi:hypothetical protein